jgi:methylenetetrahydrofolate reductase (NADPH)
MQFSDLHQTHKVVVSFELFPPKTPEAEARLFDQALPEMLTLSPAMLTCTYGAGGSTRDKTLDVVSRVKTQFGVEAASHLTCVGGSRDELSAYLTSARQHGISNIVALRGDPPAGDDSFTPCPDGFSYAVELVEFIRDFGGFDIAVAGYPEGHPGCPDKHLDWRRCAAKVEAGASVVMTQLFYDNRDFFAFDDYLKNTLGVTVPIVPGVLPILGTAQIKRFCGLCGATLPTDVLARLDAYGDDADSVRQYGVELASAMCAELLAYGVPGIHFYTLNHAQSTARIMANIGLNG